MFLDSGSAKCLSVATHRYDQLIIRQIEACPLTSFSLLPLAFLKLSLSSMSLLYQGLRSGAILDSLFDGDFLVLEIDGIRPALEEADICSLGSDGLEGGAELEGAN